LIAPDLARDDYDGETKQIKDEEDDTPGCDLNHLIRPLLSKPATYRKFRDDSQQKILEPYE